MSPEALSDLIYGVAQELVASGKAGNLTADQIPEPAKFAVMRPKDRAHGDWASNAAMQLAKKAGMKPRELAEAFQTLMNDADGIACVEVAGPGFINITLDSASAAAVVDQVLADGAAFGKNEHLSGKTLNLEFVSANPTGPIHIGGTRWAAVGDSMARVLEANGAEVVREYYFNDHGEQINRFAKSLVAAAHGEPTPVDGYKGAYIDEIARRVIAEADADGIDILDLPRVDGGTDEKGEPLGEGDSTQREEFRKRAVPMMFDEIRHSMQEFRVKFDVWFHENSLYEDGEVEKAIDDLRARGDIYEQDKRLYEIPATEPLTYYISSLSAFVDGADRYKKQIISRRVEANTACYIDFEQGSDVILEDLSNNRFEMGRIKQNLGSLIENKDFDLDSIVVTASCSPEGSVAHNAKLSQRRSESVSRYFSQFIEAYRDSLREEMLEHIYFDGADDPRETQTEIKFISRSNAENWRMLDVLVEQSEVLTENEKQIYRDIREIENLDLREQSLSWQDFYHHLREVLYPRLRTVKFDFHLHRKGMVKDTIQTTVLDEQYMAGVQAIRDRDYETAIQILRPYKDYNAAVAFCAMDYNASALDILETLPETDQVHYLLAVIYSRQGREEEAVEHYLKACKMTPSYIHRGNLDPEISELIKRYNLTNNYLQTH